MEIKNVLEIINLPGSAINFIGGQFKYLHEEGGYEMHLICSPGGGIEKFCEENHVRFQPIQLERQLNLWGDIKALMQICKYIKKNKIDVVIAHQAKGRLLGMVASLLMGVRFRVIFAHGILYETKTGVRRKLLMLNDKFVSRIATKVVCVSQFVKDTRLKDRIDKPEKQLLLGRGSCNGIDTIEKFNPSLIKPGEIENIKNQLKIGLDDFIIGFCGRLVRDKGVVELISAFQVLTNNHPEKSLKLLIIGDPENRDALPQDTLHYLKHTNIIIFTGKVPFEDIPKYYMLMNVLVLPSHREGFGMVAVEASAMQKPVIVSDYTGCAETIIPNKTGLYINQTPESIVDAVEKCFDLEYAESLGKNGRIFVSEYFEHSEVRKYILCLIQSFELYEK